MAVDLWGSQEFCERSQSVEYLQVDLKLVFVKTLQTSDGNGNQRSSEKAEKMASVLAVVHMNKFNSIQFMTC